jgi:hypothetical protein
MHSKALGQVIEVIVLAIMLAALSIVYQFP